MYPISLIGTKVPILASHNYHARMAAAKRGRMWGAELLIFQDVEVLLETSSEWLLVSLLELWSTVLITLVLRICMWSLLLVLVLVSTDFLLLVCCGVWCSFLAAGDMFIASVKKGKPELRKKGMLLISLCWFHSYACCCGETEKELEKKEWSVSLLWGLIMMEWSEE